MNTVFKSDKFGCEHYRRKLKFIAPCCSRIYTCRFCHDKNEDHSINRYDINEIICAFCGQKQSINVNCSNCQIQFGKYYCLKCNLFSDDDLDCFHCDLCGFCRVGQKDNYFHCNVCDVCLHINLKQNHKCIEKASKINCSICLEDIHTSRYKFHVPTCSHLMHKPCYNNYIDAGFKTCPICQRSITDLSSYWILIDEYIRTHPIHPIFEKYRVNIMCRDCNKESVSKLHYIGFKCYLCGSYNTYTCSRYFRLNEENNVIYTNS